MGKAEKSDRGTRRKVKTRAKLLVASRKLLAAKGLEAVSIQDITDEADVGLGSFYNHFESKMDVLKAVADEYFSIYAFELDQLVSDLKDPAELMSVSYRYTIAQALEEQNYSIIQQLPRAYIVDRIYQRAITDMEMGIKAGRFQIDNTHTLARFALSGILEIMDLYARGKISDDDACHTVTYYLCLLGVDKKEAIELARKPMPRKKRIAS